MVHENIPTHLSLFHFLDFLVELKSLLFVDELLLLGRSGCLASEATEVVSHVRAAVMLMMMVAVVMVMVMMIAVMMGVIHGRVNLGQLEWLLLNQFTVCDGI